MIFDPVKKKKAIIYGSGKKAADFISTNQEYEIVGVWDRLRVTGNINGVPVITCDEIDFCCVDVVIICATDSVIEEIYNRIEPICFYNEIKIQGMNGNNLADSFQYSQNQKRQEEVFFIQKGSIYEDIDEHDVICFDIFDTLLMRRTYHPYDIYLILEKRLKSENTITGNTEFAKIRREAELSGSHMTFDGIYDYIAQRCMWDKSTEDMVKEAELSCEIDNIVIREDIYKLFKYAKMKNKKVCLVSDMYFSEKYMKRILSFFEIGEYDGLFVSCDYGKSKGAGLFGICKEKVSGQNYLHIGDDYNSDFIGAKKEGIDGIKINKSNEIMDRYMRTLKRYENEYNCRIWQGRINAVFYNSPFVDMGKAQMDCRESAFEIGYYFYAPLVKEYIEGLIEVVSDRNTDKILFAARDGFILNNVYKELYEDSVKVPSYYFYISRKAALGIEEDNEQRRRYKEYLNRMGISKQDNCLFCDLLSSGTSLRALRNGLCLDCKGLFLYKIPGNNDDLPIISIYNNLEWGSLGCDYYILEKVLSSVDSSVVGMDEEGFPIFDVEDRTDEELETFKDIMLGIIEGVRYMKQKNIVQGKQYARALIRYSADVAVGRKTKKYLTGKLRDDLYGTYKVISYE